MASVQNMTSGNPRKLIFSFALPLMIGNLFQQLYTVADAMIMGQTLGIGAGWPKELRNVILNSVILSAIISVALLLCCAPVFKA